MFEYIPDNFKKIIKRWWWALISSLIVVWFVRSANSIFDFVDRMHQEDSAKSESVDITPLPERQLQAQNQNSLQWSPYEFAERLNLRELTDVRRAELEKSYSGFKLPASQGYVIDVSPVGNDSMRVFIGESTSTSRRVFCNFDIEFSRRLAILSKDEKIFFRGNVDLFGDSYITLNHCELLSESEI